VSDTPAVCVKRSFQGSSSLRRSAAHDARPDLPRGPILRDLLEEIECALKKNEMRGTKSSTSSPASTPHCTHFDPVAQRDASSWSAVAPASRM
jgi:hypothetical protein